MSADLAPGARVRIRTGMAGGRVGTVLSTGPSYPRPVVRVEVEIPVLLTESDGPTHVVQMPYAPDELEVLAPEPTPAPAAERAPRDAEARGTAAHAIASARSRGLHGRAALADAYQSLTAGLRLLLREDDTGVDRWGRAVTLVFERWTALEDELDAPVPYVVTETPAERVRDEVESAHAASSMEKACGAPPRPPGYRRRARRALGPTRIAGERPLVSRRRDDEAAWERWFFWNDRKDERSLADPARRGGRAALSGQESDGYVADPDGESALGGVDVLVATGIHEQRPDAGGLLVGDLELSAGVDELHGHKDSSSVGPGAGNARDALTVEDRDGTPRDSSSAGRAVLDMSDEGGAG